MTARSFQGRRDWNAVFYLAIELFFAVLLAFWATQQWAWGQGSCNPEEMEVKKQQPSAIICNVFSEHGLKRKKKKAGGKFYESDVLRAVPSARWAMLQSECVPVCVRHHVNAWNSAVTEASVPSKWRIPPNKHPSLFLKAAQVKVGRGTQRSTQKSPIHCIDKSQKAEGEQRGSWSHRPVNTWAFTHFHVCCTEDYIRPSYISDPQKVWNIWLA